MSTFEIDDPEIDVEALEKRIREAIEKKRGVRFTDDDLNELRQQKVEPLPRRDDLPGGWLEEMAEVRSTLPEISPPPGVDIHAPVALYETGSKGLRGLVLGLLRRLMRPFYRSTSNIESVVGGIVEGINVQGSWAGQSMSAMTGQLERWRARDLHLLHNLVYELTSLNLEIERTKDRINELNRRLDALAERESALERLALEPVEEPADDTSAEGSAQPREF